jgi:hypothetical protein
MEDIQITTPSMNMTYAKKAPEQGALMNVVTQLHVDVYNLGKDG